MANQRRDWQHTQARTLARRFDRIGVEDLRIRNMVRNRHLARAIHDAGWGEFVAVLDWQARKAGHEARPARPPQHDPDLLGVRCESQSAVLGLADRIFACDECGLVEDRDRNAARNLNPDRRDKPGAGVDGDKTLVPAGTEAALSPRIPVLQAGELSTNRSRLCGDAPSICIVTPLGGRVGKP